MEMYENFKRYKRMREKKVKRVVMDNEKKFFGKNLKLWDIKWIVYIVFLVMMCVFCLCNVGYKGVALTGENYKAENPIGGIYNTNVLQQYITCKSDDFFGFEIGFATYGRVNFNLVKVVLCDEKKELYTWEFGANLLEDNEYTIFLLPEKIEKAKGKKYVVRIETNSLKEDEGNNITIYSTLDEEDISEETLYGNGVLPEGTLDIRTITGFIRGRWIVVASILITIMIMGTTTAVGHSKRLSMEKKYLVVGGIIGVLYLLVLPFGVGPDENKHMMRIFEISEGHMVSEKGENGAGGRIMADNIVPFDYIDSYSEVGTYWSVSLNYDKPVSYTFGNTALYSPVSYLPQVFSVMFVKLFTDRTVIIAMFAKLAGLIFSLVVIYFSIKCVPVKKECLLLIATMPMFMQQMVVITADGFLNGIAIGFTTYILYLSYSYNEKVKNKQIAMIYLCMFLLGLCKIVFLPLCLLAFCIPWEKFGTKKKYWVILLVGLGVTCTANLVWLYISSGYLYEVRDGVNSGMQVAHILSNPVNYLNVIYNTVLEKHEIIFWEFFGDGLGALNIHVNRFGYYFFSGLLLILGVSKTDNIIIKVKDKLIMLVVALGVVALIFTSEYVQWTVVAEDVIDGIQGRYFIPIALMICIMVENKVLKLEKQKLEKYLFPFIGYINVFALISCINFLIR